MFEGPFNAYKDEENPLGICEGGAYFSFSTKSHSYNKVPQIALEQGKLSTGFYGFNFGFIADLGKVPLSRETEQTAEILFLRNYRPPSLKSEVEMEARKSYRYQTENALFFRSVPATEGNTYALRAINFREADVLVLFKIVRINHDGSAEITWKFIEKFNTPIILYQTDKELTEKVLNVLNNPKFTMVKAEVIDNKVSLTGEIDRNNMAELMRAIHEFKPIKA